MLAKEELSCYDNTVSKNAKRGTNMSWNVRRLISVIVYIIGLATAVYVGGWVMLVKPVKGAVTAYMLGTLTLPQVIITILKCFFSLTVAGFIWCLGYIASNRIYDSRDE